MPAAPMFVSVLSRPERSGSKKGLHRMLQTFYRLRDVTRITGKSRSEIYEDIARGDFPKPIKLSAGGRSVAWLERDLAQWQAERVAERDGKEAA